MLPYDAVSLYDSDVALANLILYFMVLYPEPLDSLMCLGSLRDQRIFVTVR